MTTTLTLRRQGLELHPISAPWRLLARLRADSLDAALAAGAQPDSARLLAVRASMLVGPGARRRLARQWAQVPDRAVASQFAVLDRAAIADSVPDITALVNALTTAGPVDPRGVAMALILLTDGTGPLHRRTAPPALSAALQAATRALTCDAEGWALLGSNQ